MTKRVLRLGLGLLLLNLSFVGQEVACAHEAQGAEHTAATHHQSSESHHAPEPAVPDRVPCDESPQCCDAIASCAIAGIPGGGPCDTAPPTIQSALIAGIDFHGNSAPLEVATPPPRA